MRTAHRILSKALNDAVRDGVLPRHPPASVPLPRQVKPDLQVWDRSQVAACLEVAQTDRLRVASLLALLCRLRRGELVGLRWTGVDLEQGVLSVAGQRTTDAEWRGVTKEPKGTSRRSVDLGPVVLGVLVAHRWQGVQEALQRPGPSVEPGGLALLQADGQPHHPDRLRELFQALAREAGVPVIRLP